MDRTGSIAIARELATRRGGLIVSTGMLVLLTSSVVHATPVHLAAALLFGVGMATIRILAKNDEIMLGTPWRDVVRLTDHLSLIALGIATFGPLLIVATGGHPGWDVPVLGGVLAVWWTVLDRLIADYRSIRFVLVVLLAAWLPVVLMQPPARQMAHGVAILTIIALGATAWSLIAAMRRVPRYYGIIDVDRKDAA